MAFSNDETFTDDFRKVGADSTAEFSRVGAPDNPTEHASSENLAASVDDDEDEVDEDDLDEEDDDDLEDDEELDDEDDDDEDLGDDDLDEDDEDEEDEDEDDDIQ